MNPWAALAPLLKNLVDVVSKALLGFFLIRQGEKNQQLADLKKEEDNARNANKDHAAIDGMPDDELRGILQDCRPGCKCDKGH